jgi:beta-phosphoglucomutase
MQTVVITTTHDQKEFAEYKNVIAFVKDYDDEYLKQLIS